MFIKDASSCADLRNFFQGSVDVCGTTSSNGHRALPSLESGFFNRYGVLAPWELKTRRSITDEFTVYHNVCPSWSRVDIHSGDLRGDRIRWALRPLRTWRILQDRGAYLRRCRL